MNRIILSVISLLTIFSAAATSRSGKVNKNVSWELTDSTLYIRGNGPMSSYTPTSLNQIPWLDDQIAREITSIVIEEGITEVGNYAFGFLSEIKDTRTEADRYSEEAKVPTVKYYKVRTLSLPSSLQKIGKNAFSKLPITSVKFPEGLKEIGFGAFSDTDLLSAILPSGLNKLGAEAFSGCDFMQAVDLNDAKIDLRAGTFFDCSKLRMILHPANVKSIQPSTFNATIFQQFSPEYLLSMFQTDGLENYITMNLPEEASDESKLAVIDEFYVNEAKNATVIFNLDDFVLTPYDSVHGQATLRTTNHGQFLLNLTPEQYSLLQNNLTAETLKPTYHPSDGHVKIQFITVNLSPDSIIAAPL
ncbi:MAG: leucine-rich repeat domain-containing protein [Muribaculaceae bacterium]|nr:leucine-rich repeat domain-containing protein [Muribaculaceae bacterium]